eukprot:2307351-Rhodomonas_salina.1
MPSVIIIDRLSRSCHTPVSRTHNASVMLPNALIAASAAHCRVHLCFPGATPSAMGFFFHSPLPLLVVARHPSGDERE